MIRRNVPILVRPPMKVQRASQHFNANRQKDAELCVGQRTQCVPGVIALLGAGASVVVVDQLRQDLRPGQQPFRHAQICFWPVSDNGWKGGRGALPKTAAYWGEPCTYNARPP